MIQSTPVMSETLPAQTARCLAVPRRLGILAGDHAPPAPAPSRPRAGRRRRSRPERFAPLALVALARASARACTSAARHEPAAAAVARQWAAAWERGDYAGDARAAVRRARAARQPAALRAHLPRGRRDGDAEQGAHRRAARRRRRRLRRCRSRMETRIFGRLRGTVRLPMIEEEDGAGVDWRAPLVFPGLRPGEKLARETTLAARGAILARDGTPLAKGPDRLSDLGPLAAEVAGRVGPAPPERAAELARRGVPEGAPVGLNGLEREFDERLAGSPGGILRAGSRVVARAERARRRPTCARRSTPTSSAPRSRRSPGRFGGIAVLRPATGEVLGLSGIAFSAPQPPGSTFKIITLAGALEAGKVKPSGEVPGADADRRSRASRSRTPTARPAAARCGSPSPTPATPSSRRWAPSSARSGSSRRPSASASTRTRARSGPRARRSRPPTRSATTWRSARPRSARARCSPPRSSSPPWPRRSGCAAAASPRRSRAARRARRRARRASAPRASSRASCARS